MTGLRLGLFAIALGWSASLPVAVSAACSETQLRLKGAFGQASFTVEVADDDKTRAMGLMNRDALARFAGMLFVYERPQQARFWMKNTLIPLDMLFADESGTIKGIHAMATPLSTDIIDGGDGIFAVLEVNGGLAARLGIKPGDQMQHPAFAPNNPVWPCQ